ncbi:hypothetical protein GGR56DRAFT_315952 [Xylariaceae sp. FL0804]|nr:hypothetical protein GGR56DRAFT_315952 [Xylariaceae sp. FL0804]
MALAKSDRPKLQLIAAISLFFFPFIQACPIGLLGRPSSSLSEASQSVGSPRQKLQRASPGPLRRRAPRELIIVMTASSSSSTVHPPFRTSHSALFRRCSGEWQPTDQPTNHLPSTYCTMYSLGPPRERLELCESACTGARALVLLPISGGEAGGRRTPRPDGMEMGMGCEMTAGGTSRIHQTEHDRPLVLEWIGGNRLT